MGTFIESVFLTKIHGCVFFQSWLDISRDIFSFFFFLFSLPACRGTLSVLQFLLDPETLFFRMFHYFYMKMGFFLKIIQDYNLPPFNMPRDVQFNCIFRAKLALLRIKRTPLFITFWNFFQGLRLFWTLEYSLFNPLQCPSREKLTVTYGSLILVIWIACQRQVLQQLQNGKSLNYFRLLIKQNERFLTFKSCHPQASDDIITKWLKSTTWQLHRNICESCLGTLIL